MDYLCLSSLREAAFQKTPNQAPALLPPDM